MDKKKKFLDEDVRDFTLIFVHFFYKQLQYQKQT